ncbi:aminopeptidase [Streptomyces purpurascens]
MRSCPSNLRSAVGEDEGAGPRTFRSVTTLRFRSTSPRASSFADLIAPSVTAVSLNGRDLGPGEVFDGSKRWTWPPTTSWSSTPHARGRLRRPQGPECASVTRSTSRPSSGRVFANFEQPDLKAPFRFEVRARRGHIKGVPVNSATGSGGSPRPSRSRRTSRVWWRGPSPLRGTDSYSHVLPGRHDGWRSRSAPRCAARASRPLRLRRRVPGHRAGPGLLHDRFNYPYPFGIKDQAFVPEYNLGAMETLVKFQEDSSSAGKVTQASYEPGQCHRDGARVGFGRTWSHEWWDDLREDPSRLHEQAPSRLRGRRAGFGWITFPPTAARPRAYRATSCPPRAPRHAGHPRSAGRQAELRRHSSGACVLEAARGVRRQHVQASACSSGTRYGNTPQPAAEVLETSGRDVSRGRGSRSDGRGELADAAARPGGHVEELAVVGGRRVASGTAPGGGGPVPGDGRRPRLERISRTETDVDGADGGGRAGGSQGSRPGAGQRRRPHVLQDPLRRDLASERCASTWGRCTIRWRVPCAGRRCNMTRTRCSRRQGLRGSGAAVRGARVPSRAPDAGRP